MILAFMDREEYIVYLNRHRCSSKTIIYISEATSTPKTLSTSHLSQHLIEDEEI